MKKVLTMIIVLLSLLIVMEVEASSPTIYVDGRKTKIIGEIKNGRTFVSLKTLCKELNCQYGYKNRNDKLNEIVTIYANLDNQIIDDNTSSKALIEIRYKINSTVYQPYVTLQFDELENRFQLKPINEVKSIVKNQVNIPFIGKTGTGDLYVPIRFIANGLGHQVEWDGSTGSVHINLAKPNNYEHLIVTEKLKFGSKVDKTKISNEVTKGNCLTVIASQDGVVLNNSTLLSFIGGSTELRDDGQYKISQLYTESVNKNYYGSFANICPYENNEEITKVVSISTPNYYPYIQVHNIKTTNNTNDEVNETEDNKETTTQNVQTTKNLINVPIDSRPVSRSKFSDLVTAAGYNYLEVSDGITDYVNNNIKSSWVIGNPIATRNQLYNMVRNNNTTDTSVIINTSSYIFGGLGATRSPRLYNDFSSLNELESIVKTYNKPTYYVTAVLPRVYPEECLDDWSWPIKVGGLNYYINGANNESYKVSYTEALVEWYYLKYMNEATNNYNSWPTSVKTFYNNFYTWYVEKGGEKTTWEYQTYNSNVVRPWEYDQMYKGFYEMFKSLVTLQSKTGIELVILVDDYELPRFITANQNKYDWIIKDTNGQAIKYSAAYDVLRKIESYLNQSNNSKINLIYGTDEINHLILARDLVKRDGTGIDLDVNYSYSGLRNYIGDYDKASVGELITEADWFINEYGRSNQENVNLQLVKIRSANDSAIKTTADNVYNLVNKNKTVMVTDISNSNVKQYFISKMANQNLFQIPYYGGWNTVANAVGISLSSITVYSDLKNDIDECVESKRCSNTLTSDLENRLIAYDKSRIVNVLEDEIYNGIVRDRLSSYGNYIDLNRYNVLSNVTNPNKSFKINKYTYYYDSLSYNAYNPWPRVFEVKVDTNLGNIVYK